MVVVLATLVVPTVTAQKINANSHKAKLEKSNVEIETPKKSDKAATWINRGKICINAILAPTQSIFSGLTTDMLQMSLGVAPDAINGDVQSFEWIDVYTKSGKVVAWDIKKEVLDNAYDIAKEAFLKAYELDKSAAPKIKDEIEKLVKYYTSLGSGYVDIMKYDKAIDAYMKVAGLQENPAIGQVNPTYYFLSGQLAAFLGSKQPKYFKEGQAYLEKALDLKYKDEEGLIYYFLFHCYYGQREDNPDNLIKAKNTLLDGIKKYPRNERIMEGLIQLYTSEKNIGDPAELVGHLDKMLSEKPDNIDLWYARGQVFFHMRNFDECISSFLKINELKPNDYNTNFYLGYFHMAKGDEANRAFNARIDSINSQEEHQAGLNEVNAVYMKALPWFEKAMELKPESVDCAEYLKVLCYRLRNEEGIMEKYNKYNAIFKKLKGIQ